MMTNPKIRSEILGETTDPGVVRVPAIIYPYSAGIKGGLLGGLAMVPIALAYGVVSGRGIWYPVNLIAATFLPAWQHASAAQLAQFQPDGLVIGLTTHLVMSVLLGLIFAVMLPALPLSPLFWAFVIGPLLWGGAVFAGLPLLNPIMAQFIDLPSFALANILYSLVLGLWMARTPKIDLNWPFRRS